MLLNVMILMKAMMMSMKTTDKETTINIKQPDPKPKIKIVGAKPTKTRLTFPAPQTNHVY